MSYVNRHVVPDEEGYLYWVKTPSGYLYGPYSNRANAANGAGQRKPYVPERIWDYHTRTYIPNPQFGQPTVEWEIVKAKIGEFVPAPKLTLKDKLAKALERIAELEKYLGVE